MPPSLASLATVANSGSSGRNHEHSRGLTQPETAEPSSIRAEKVDWGCVDVSWPVGVVSDQQPRTVWIRFTSAMIVLACTAGTCLPL